MCGIAGLFNYFSETSLRRMLDTMQNRGPDSTDILFDPSNQIYLGHNRLSIIDLSESGRQPMTDSSGRFSITYNGEIYNYQELREELKQLGYFFQTQTDTEVLLVAYKEWGGHAFIACEECLPLQF